MASGPLAPAPPPTSSFDGLSYGADCGGSQCGDGHPPDTNGDVGPTHYIQTINTSIGIFNKSTGNRVAAFTFNAFMSQGSFGNLCDTDNFGDPVVVYDSYHDRWIITDFAFQVDPMGNIIDPPGSYQCFAVSSSGNPVSGGWNFYSLHLTDYLQDYPKFGVWPDGLYMSANMYGFQANGGFKRVRVWALNLAQMEAGDATAQVVSFDAPSKIQGVSVFTMLPSNARVQTGTPPAGRPNFFASVWGWTNRVRVWKFHVDWSNTANSTFTGPTDSMTGSTWAAPPQTVPSDNGNDLDTLPMRLMMQNQYTNIGGVESLWDTHTVRGSSSSQAAVRWYQVPVSGGTVGANTIQAATWNPDSANRFMPSAAVDRLGNMAMGYTVASSSMDPAIRYAGRLASDSINTFGQTEQSLIEGTGTQTGNCGGSQCERWGDYSAMALDPDGCTLWYTNEYYVTDGLDHHTRIGAFSFPGCTPLAPTNLIVASATGPYGGSLNLSATLTSSGNPVGGKTISFSLNGSPVGSATTNGSGVASLNGVSLSGIASGVYPTGVSASFTGDSTHAPSGGTNSLTVLSADGSGTLTTPTSSVSSGSTGNTIVFTYTAATGGLAAGAVSVTVPAGWSAPSTANTNPGYITASAGTVGVAGQTVTVSNLTLSGGSTFTITYGATSGGGPGATAPSSTGAQTWQGKERSSSGGTLTDLASSPSITLQASGPGAPTGLTATAKAGGQIDLSWTASSGPNLAGYNVYRGTASGFTPGPGNRIVSLVAGTTYSDPGSSTVDGTTYYYLVRAEDTNGTESGNSNEAAATADKAAPDTTIDSGPSGVVNSQSAQFTFSSTELGATFECRLDGEADFITCSSPKSYSALPEGSHTFRVRALDGVLNADGSPAVRNWSIDLTPPQVTAMTPSNGATAVAVGTSATATFDEAMDAASISTSTFTLKETGSGIPVTGSVTYDAGTHVATFTPAAPLSNGTSYTATVTSGAKDVAGNALAAPATSSFVTAAAGDTTDPQVTVGDPTGGATLAGTLHTISGGATDDVEVFQVQVAIRREADGFYWNGTSFGGATVVWNQATMSPPGGGVSVTWSYPWSLPSSDGGSFTILARAVDTSSNIATEASVAVLVDTIAPQDAQMTEPTAMFQHQLEFTVSWSATDPGSGVSAYAVERQDFAPKDEGSGWTAWQDTSNTQASFTGQRGHGYCFRTQATDGAGNTSSSSQEACTTLPLDDRQFDRRGDWTKKSSTGSYLDTVTVSRQRGARLIRSVLADHLAILVTTCPGCGKVKVSFGGGLIGKFDLDTPTTEKNVLIDVVTFGSPQEGKVVIQVVSRHRPVRIDGLGAAHVPA